MRFFVTSLLIALATPALAEGEGDAPPPIVAEQTVTAYLDSRFTAQHVMWDGLLPTTTVPSFFDITEGNLQLKRRYDDKLLFFGDASFFWQAGGTYYTKDADGNRTSPPEADNPALRPLVVLSELFVTYGFNEHLNLTLGKKRIVWGPGFALNPTDLLNPPKDPTDPTFQRAGSWLARVELPYDDFTFSFVGAGKVLRQYSGIPSSLLWYPDYPTAEAVANPAVDDRDTEAHFAVAARAYVLFKETDINLYYYFSNLYNDAFTNKHRGGFSVSHVFGGWELHLEALAQTGSYKMFANPACVETVQKLRGCFITGTFDQIASRKNLDSGEFTPRVLAGARYAFEDSALFSVEYAFLGDGYNNDEYGAYLSLLKNGQEIAKQVPGAAAALGRIAGQSSRDPGSPQKFAFDPARRHYAFFTYQKPQIHDDFTVNVVLIIGLEDLSGQVAPSLTWNAVEWLNLTAGFFAPIPGVSDLGALASGTRYTEYGLLPTDWRGYVSARAFF